MEAEKYKHDEHRVWLQNLFILHSNDDYDNFLDEVEEDEDMRKNMNIYKNPAVSNEEAMEQVKKSKAPHVSLEELLDDMNI